MDTRTDEGGTLSNGPSRIVPWVGGLGGDLRTALRRTKRRPVFTTVIILVTGLGLGAATGIFTVFDAALLRPLPYAAADRLVHAWETRSESGEQGPTSYATLLDWRERVDSFAELEGYNPMNVTVGTGEEARMLRGGEVTVGFFRLLGVQPEIGRGFLQGERSPAAGGEVIVSHRFARTSGDDGNTTAVGRTITLNNAPYTVIGVLPRTFHFAPLQDADVWVPFAPGAGAASDRSQRGLSAIGRLGASASLATAQGELSTISSNLASEYPDTMEGRAASVLPLRDALLGNVKPIVVSLFAAVVLLLVAMAANLALLTLTRNLERSPEFALRMAIGAGRARIARQLLVEGLVLACAGGVLALGVAHMVTRGLLHLVPAGVRVDVPYLADIGLDGTAVAFIVGAAILLAVAAGLVPALVASGRGAQVRASRATRGRRHRHLRQGLVGAQLGLTVVLLVTAGLLVDTFQNLVGQDLGIADPAAVVAARTSLSGPRYETSAAQREYYDELLARVAALPGIGAVAAISEEPGGGGRFTTVDRADRPLPRSSQPRSALRIVAGDYFSTMGIPLLAGRALREGGPAAEPSEAVVSAGLARRLFEGGSATGRRIRLVSTGDREWKIVGIAGEVPIGALDAESQPVVYVHHDQLAENRMSLVLRTDRRLGPVASDLRTLVRAIDPGVPLYAVGTVEQKMHESRAVFSRRLPMVLIAAFAATALILALVGLYAMVAHAVLSRRREFAIRIAVGASPSEVRRLVMRWGLGVGVAGTAAGVLAAVPAARGLGGLLYGTAPLDWRISGAVAFGVLALVLCATLQPALRAAAVHPGAVMREEG